MPTDPLSLENSRLKRQIHLMTKFSRLKSPIHRERGILFSKFLMNECEFVLSEPILASHFHSAWSTWCETQGEIPCTPQVTGKLMTALFPDVYSKVVGSGVGQQKKAYTGIRLINELPAKPSPVPLPDTNAIQVANDPDQKYVLGFLPNAFISQEELPMGSTSYFVRSGKSSLMDPCRFGGSSTVSGAWKIATRELRKLEEEMAK